MQSRTKICVDIIKNIQMGFEPGSVKNERWLFGFLIRYAMSVLLFNTTLIKELELNLNISDVSQTVVIPVHES